MLNITHGNTEARKHRNWFLENQDLSVVPWFRVSVLVVGPSRD